jgi:4-hydroxy-tetrahydrodipicolinate synthase
MVTPFKSNEDLDLDAFRSNIDYYVENRVHGLVVGGSTGEFATLHPDEHRELIKTAVDQVNGRVPLLAGTAYCSTRYTIEMSKFAQDAGVDGLLIVPPFYSKPKDEEIYQHYSDISKAVNIPIMVYNNPFTSKVDMKPELIERLSKLQNVTHVKESSSDITRLWKIRQLTDDKLTIFAGADNLAFESFAMGAKGWICVAANVLPRECSELYELAVLKNDIEGASKLYNKLLPMGNLFEDSGMFAALSKAGLDMLGEHGGKPRRPMMPPGPNELEQLRSILKTFGKVGK